MTTVGCRPGVGAVRDGTSNGSILSWIATASAICSTPVRAGTGGILRRDRPVEDLTGIDFAEDRDYRTSGILAIPGYGYVFEMDGGDGFLRYGALRVTHVGQTFIIVDWAFQTDPGNGADRAERVGGTVERPGKGERCG
jgi:hypothetical protein